MHLNTFKANAVISSCRAMSRRGAPRVLVLSLCVNSLLASIKVGFHALTRGKKTRPSGMGPRLGRKKLHEKAPIYATRKNACGLIFYASKQPEFLSLF